MAGSDTAVTRPARPYQGRRKAVHGVAESVCGSKRCVVAHELREIPVDDAVTLLDWIVAREDVLRIVVAKSQVKGVDIVERLKNTPLTCKFAPCRPHRHVAGGASGEMEAA